MVGILKKHCQQDLTEQHDQQILKSKKGKRSRRRGQHGEREVCNIINDTLGLAVSRNLDQVRSGGGDVILGEYHLEIKRHEHLNIPAYCRQAEAACGDRTPVIVYRSSRQPWRVVITLDTFLELVREDLCESIKIEEHNN